MFSLAEFCLRIRRMSGQAVIAISIMEINKLRVKSPNMYTDKNVRILVVEDSDTVRKLMVHELEAAGFKNVVCVPDGKDAWELLQNDKFDLILSDWHMVHMSGLELLKLVRSSAGLRKTPFLMVTSVDEKDQVIAAASMGLNGYIIKPPEAKVLAEKIAAVLAANKK